MAAIVERTVHQDLTEAIAALGELTRFARDTHAHLRDAQRQAGRSGSGNAIAPDTLFAARHAAQIVTACAASVERSIRNAQLRAVTDD